MNHYTSHSLDCGMPVTLAWTTDVNKFFRVSTPSILVSLVIKCILEKPWACGIDYKPPYLDCCMRVTDTPVCMTLCLRPSENKS